MNILIKLAAILGAASVGLGAFGAHGLKKYLTEYGTGIFETGIKYMFYHTLAMLAAGILYHLRPAKHFMNAGWLFLAGILIFSGSLVLLSLMPDKKWLGAITPIGGVCFIAGWILLFLGAAKS